MIIRKFYCTIIKVVLSERDINHNFPHLSGKRLSPPQLVRVPPRQRTQYTVTV